MSPLRHAAPLLALLLSTLALAADLRTVAQDATEPKFVIAGGKVTGLCIDIYRAIEKADPGLRFTGDQAAMPLARAESEMAAGNIDANCGLVHNKERDQAYVFIDPPLFPVDYLLLTRRDDPIEVASWDEVRKLGAKGQVLVNAGTGQVKRLEDMGGLTIDASAKLPQQNLQKLASGRGRFYYVRSLGLRGELKRAGVADQLRIPSRAIESTPFHLLLGKHVPKDVVERVRKAVAQLAASGELARLLDKWDDQ
ncbi:substrate-binding periplasmic protein [Chitinimonas koreensis]|uniref:substrate-binding periplasmic protein n=1 Tax=Chitinimonas koreensis TaxID=356302 RepID=UPI0004042A45|nr:transporter substrate-binding domain-containing protein [Chitinimonas koreensis]QNM97469.1 transporter substrate-binding domain-containing protein [Chitinimonas koreensis]